MTVISNLKKNFISFRTNRKPSNQPEIVPNNFLIKLLADQTAKSSIKNDQMRSKTGWLKIRRFGFGVYV